jgi:hypothetical protein
VEDLAQGVVRALASPEAAGRTYNLGGRETITIRGLAELVREEVGHTPIVHTEERHGDLRGVHIDSSRAERELGWRATTPLREGVRRYATWLGEQDGAATAVSSSVSVPTPGKLAPRRTVAATVAAWARNQAAVGIVAMVAVASASATAIVGASEEPVSAEFTILGLALLLPLWALTTVEWAPGHQRLQCAVTALYGGLAVVFLAVLSSITGDGGLPHRSLELALAASAGVTGALRIVPRVVTGHS